MAEIDEQTNIDIHNNTSSRIEEMEFVEMMEAVETARASNKLDLAWKNLTDDHIALLVPLIKGTPNITTIDLGVNEFGVKGAKEIAHGLIEKNAYPHIISMDLSVNKKIGIEGIAILAKALETNSTIASLHLCVMDLHEQGAKHIAEMLKVNRSITTLNLDGDKIGDKGLHVLLQGMEENNNTLESISLYKNDITDDSAKLLFQFIRRQQQQKQKQQQHQGQKGKVVQSDDEMLALLEQEEQEEQQQGRENEHAIREPKRSTKSACIRRVSLGMNQLTDETAVVIGDFLADVDTSIAFLDIAKNHLITERGAAYIAKSLFKKFSSFSTMSSTLLQRLEWSFSLGHLIEEHLPFEVSRLYNTHEVMQYLRINRECKFLLFLNAGQRPSSSSSSPSSSSFFTDFVESPLFDLAVMRSVCEYL